MALKKLDNLVSKKIRIRADLLERMTACARLRLPAQLAEACWVGGFDNKLVHLVTNQSAFAEPIYFRQYEIIKQLNEEFSHELQMHFKRVRVHINHSSVRQNI